MDNFLKTAIPAKESYVYTYIFTQKSLQVIPAIVGIDNISQDSWYMDTISKLAKSGTSWFGDGPKIEITEIFTNTTC